MKQLDSTNTAFWQQPLVWLGIVATLYFVVQIVAVDPGRFFEWDEAVYTAEVSRYADAIFLDAHRARGVTFVVAPIVQVTDSMTVIRIYLSSVSAAGLFFAFLSWVRVSRWAAPVGAALFASSWLAIFYGSEIIPNIYSALLVVASLGLAIRFLQIRRGAYLYGVAMGVALAAFVRPLDAVMVTGGIAVLSVLVGLRTAWKPLVAAGTGLVIGMVPWLIEASVRFGGLMGRLERSREIVGGGFNNNVIEYLRLMDGPLSWPDRSPAISGVLAVWMISLVCLAIIGVAMSSGFDRKVAVSALASSAILAAPYLVLSEASAPRFMMPALALLCLSAGVGLSTAAARFESVPVRASVAVVLALLLVANAGTLDAIADDQDLARAGGRQLAQALDDATQSGTCYFLSSSGYPQISIASGCGGGRITGDLEEARRRLSTAAGQGLDVFVLANNPETIEVLDTVGECQPIEVVSSANWQICNLTGSQWLEHATDG